MRWKIALLLGTLTEFAFCQDVRINELMYAPSGGAPEWVELFNAGSEIVNIRYWTISSKTGVPYSISTSNRYIASHSFLVLTNSDKFENFYPGTSAIYVTVKWPQYFLVNTGDTVMLHSSTGMLVDSVYYAPSWGGSGGKSLERKSVSDSSRAKNNWGTSVDPAGSTPGRMNSITLKEIDLKITSFSAIYRQSESKTFFDVLVTDAGAGSAPPFSMEIFSDNNGDSIAQSDELIAADTEPGPAHGDSVHVLIAKETGNPGNHRFIARIDCPSDEDTTNNSMIASLGVSYAAGSVVVNEIMYAPASPQPEWVEVFNTSQDTVCLDGFSITDNSGTAAVIRDAGARVPPSGYVVVAHDSSFFTYNSELRSKTIIAKIPSLNNSGDAVVIRDAAGETIDSVDYSPSWGGNSGGKSLERILPGGNSNDPQNFETCVDTAKSTPGRINSVTPRDHDLAVGGIIVTPVHLRSGDNAVITADIVNAGLEPTGGATAILFEDSNHDGLYDYGELTDSVPLNPLPAGDSLAASFSTGVLSYGSHHFGIIVEFPGDERQYNNSKTINVYVGLSPAAVVINEVMYAPKQPEQEWLELYNTGTSVIDLSNFRIVTHGSSVKTKAGAYIGPNDFAVLCKDSSVSRLHCPVGNLLVQSVPPLNNGGDGVGLYDNLGNLLDTMSYLPSYGGSTGRSLERVDYLEGNDSTNWEESVDTSGATPGMQNSAGVLPFDAAIKRLDMSAVPGMPGETGVISVVISNRGRNAAANIPVSVNILRVLDSSTVCSQTMSFERTLLPKDSATERFSFSLEKSGLYTAFARITFEKDTRSRNDTLSAGLNIGYTAQSMVINEIMFTNGRMGEYFEILNSSRNKTDIAGWSFHTSSSHEKPICISIASKIIEPDGYFIVAGDSAVFNYVPDTNSIHYIKSLSLRDDGDCVVISDPDGNIVDSVYYQPSWHNSDIANTSGRSLEKINPSLPSNERTSWSTSVSQFGGTPGARNSLFMNPGQTASTISVAPNPFSPDGDGHDDFTFVSYSFPVTSVKIRARIFDSVGRLIATPADNVVLPSTGRLVWDGRDGSGKIVRFGLYIMFMEVTGPDGRSLATYKEPLVVAKKMR